MLKQYNIDESFLCSVNTRKEYSNIKDPSNPTNEELITILKGHDKIVVTGSKDHDEFTKLRDQLELDGYITTNRNWWNGDRVVRGFKLNEWTFKKGHKFPCAGAIKVSIECARHAGRKSISSL